MKNFNFNDVPSSVYRLQLSPQFTFNDATKILPYLKELGLEGVYCSPYFKAFTAHGYDVTDPNALNPQLGSGEDFKHFCQTLKELGLKHLIDVVPNHMGIKGGQNLWWQDVLENGPYSEYASYFDINWSPEKKELQDRVLLPILGEPYGTALEKQEIRLAYAEGQFTLQYADYPLPVAPHTYAMILEKGIERVKKQYDEDSTDWIDFQDLISLYRFFPVAFQERTLKKAEGRAKLHALYTGSAPIRTYIDREVVLFNGIKNKTDSFDALDKLLEGQFYRLSYWRVARHEINYRRFFNIPELVSLRMEDEKVFQNHHRFLFQLIQEGYIDGLRIDHPDGLYYPAQYFERLRAKVPIFTVIEKILGRKEKLAEEWQVEGTVGYEYLNYLNGLFIVQDNAEAFTRIYEEFTGEKNNFEEVLYRSKKFFTNYRMVSEVETLGLRIDRLSETHRDYRDFTRHELTQALAEVIAFFPVYRTYVGPEGEPSQEDCHQIKVAIEKAKTKAKELDLIIFDFLESILTARINTGPDSLRSYRELALYFQQITSPIMAKGMEDTAFYQYNRFISLNEVGGDPTHFGYSLGEFHTFNQDKRKRWPFGLLPTSTHDTKRSEDVRARLNVLSEIPDKWKAEVTKWAFANSSRKPQEISANTEYQIYQTLLGVWPSMPIKKENYEEFCERLWQIILKYIREAKQETNWVFPNEAYEEAIRSFVLSILTKEKSNRFLKFFMRFHKFVNHYGGLNSLSQSVIKIASPGVVDIYQGNEILNYRLVDPDNRMPVDFELRLKYLKSLRRADTGRLFADQNFTKLKLYVQTKALHCRLENKQLFLEGEYIPLKVSGQREQNIIAFARKQGEQYLIAVAGRFFTGLASADWDLPLGKHAWGDTAILLPEDFIYTTGQDIFTEKEHQISKTGNSYSLFMADIFTVLPICYLLCG